MTQGNKSEKMRLFDRLVAVSGREEDRVRYQGADLDDLRDMVERAERHVAEMDRLFPKRSRRRRPSTPPN
jgi:hypothetical protein